MSSKIIPAIIVEAPRTRTASPTSEKGRSTISPGATWSKHWVVSLIRGRWSGHTPRILIEKGGGCWWRTSWGHLHQWSNEVRWGRRRTTTRRGHLFLCQLHQTLSDQIVVSAARGGVVWVPVLISRVVVEIVIFRIIVVDVCVVVILV